MLEVFRRGVALTLVMGRNCVVTGMQMSVCGHAADPPDWPGTTLELRGAAGGSVASLMSSLPALLERTMRFAAIQPSAT